MPNPFPSDYGFRKVNPLEVALIEKPRLTADAPHESLARFWQTDDESFYHGVWQMEPGVLRDAPGPETVIVLEGRATVTVAETGAVVEVGPGDVGIIEAGHKATWTVHETIRKIYIVNKKG
jgi:uncharacterized cupin superfamily protein